MRAKDLEVLADMRGLRKTRRDNRVRKFDSCGVRRFSVLEQCPARPWPWDIVDSGVSRWERKAGGSQLPESNKSLDRMMTRRPVCDTITADREDTWGPHRSAQRWMENEAHSHTYA